MSTAFATVSTAVLTAVLFQHLNLCKPLSSSRLAILTTWHNSGHRTAYIILPLALGGIPRRILAKANTETDCAGGTSVLVV